MAITGATIIDGTGKAPLSEGVVLIRDGRITAVGHSRAVAMVFDTYGPRVAQVKARDMINADEAAGSRIYLAGNIIGFDGLLSADFFPELASPVSKAFAKRINEMWEQGTGRRLHWITPEEVRSVIRGYAQKNVDFLKYAAGAHLRHSAAAHDRHHRDHAFLITGKQRPVVSVLATAPTAGY